MIRTKEHKVAYDILWRVHAFLMASSYLALLSGIFISLVFKSKRWRFKTHKNLGIYAAISGVTALITIFIMVELYSGAHLTSLHAVLGAATAVFLITTPLFGLRIMKGANKKRAKIIHKLFGYTTFVLMTITLISGLAFVGIVSFY